MTMAAREVVVLCPAGFEAVVSRCAVAELRGFRVSHCGSGFLRAHTPASVPELRAFRPATNVISVICSCQRRSLKLELAQLGAVLSGAPVPQGMPRRGSFRLRIHDDGAFAPTTGTTGASAGARRLIETIEQWSGLKSSPSGARTEFWLVRRAEQPETVFGTKLTGGNERVAAGVLRPDVAATVARVAPLAGLDVLDPFAGSGSLGQACLEAGAEHMWLNDTDGKVLSRKKLPVEFRPRTRVTHVDFRDLDLRGGPVNAVVTDPPWGQYREPPEGMTAFYADFGAAVNYWLAKEGLVVMLTGAEEAAQTLFLDRARLRVVEAHSVLVNGRKARVVYARRQPHSQSSATAAVHDWRRLPNGSPVKGS